jgi:hypothetical protein
LDPYRSKARSGRSGAGTGVAGSPFMMTKENLGRWLVVGF